MNIAIVEVDSLTAFFIAETLKDLGHDILGTFDSAQPLLDQAENLPLDLVFMDVEINGKMDGIECAVKLQKEHKIPSIFITSYQNSDTINDAMDASPLGYLIKPVNESEIEAALALAKVSLKTKKVVKESSIIGKYEFNFKYKILTYEKLPVKLSKNEQKVVELLFKNSCDCVLISEIISYIWEDTYKKEESLRELIYRLRKKLPELNIVSSSKIGYLIEC